MSVVWMLFVAIGLYAALVDLAVFRIPNMAVLALCLLFLGVAFFHRAEISWLDHLGAGVLGLAAGIVLYLLRQMGAGDAKLLAAFFLWSGFTSLGPLLIWMAVWGTVLLVVLLGLRRLMSWLKSEIPRLSGMRLPKVLLKNEGIPYGVCLVLGAVFASLSFPVWIWRL